MKSEKSFLDAWQLWRVGSFLPTDVKGQGFVIAWTKTLNILLLIRPMARCTPWFEMLASYGHLFFF